MIVRTYRDLIDGLNARRKELGLPMMTVNLDAQLQFGYAEKIFCGVRNLGPLSFGALLKALNVELVLRPRNSENSREAA
jgi:hypothetical protein